MKLSKELSQVKQFFLSSDRWFWSTVLFACVIAFCIRAPFLGKIPSGLNRDEAALAYNAYSIAQNGTDEYGTPYPASFPSFGDQKLPGYIYTLVPFIWMNGINTITPKIPSFLAGFIIITCMAEIARRIAPKQFQKETVFFTSILVASSPWGNHFSRIAYESHLALAYTLLGSIAFLSALSSKTQRQRILLPFAALTLSLSVATYHSYHVLIPFLAIGSSLLFWKQWTKLDKTAIFLSILIAGSVFFWLFQGGVWQANQTKFAGISPYSKESVEAQYFVIRQAIPGNTIFERGVANKYVVILSTFAHQVFQGVAPSSFFIATESHGVHNPPGISTHFGFAFFFILPGLFLLWQRAQEKELSARYALLWSIAAFVAPALTIAPQHTVRLSSVFPFVDLLTALGIVAIFQALSQGKVVKKTFFALALFLLFTFSVLQMVLQYWFVSPVLGQKNSHAKYHVIAQELKRLSQEYDQVVTQSPEESPYIWYLFQNAIDPQWLLQNIERYPKDREGFQHVKRVGNIFFEKIDWTDLEKRAEKQSIVIVVKPQELPQEKRVHERFKFLKDIQTENAQNTEYEIWRIQAPASNLEQ